jgi:hypothetical protein
VTSFLFNFDLILIKPVAIDNRSIAEFLVVKLLRRLQYPSVLDPLVPSLLFVLVLVAHMRMGLAHVAPEGLSLRILLIANGAYVLLLLLVEVGVGLSSGLGFRDRLGLGAYLILFILGYLSGTLISYLILISSKLAVVSAIIVPSTH